MDGNRTKRAVVTGGAGFLGSHLCTRLIAEGCEVVCVDNFHTGSKDNLAHLLDEPAFELIHHDVTSPLSFDADEVYNLACPASPTHYQHDPIKTIKTNVQGAIHVLELAERTGAKVFQASTSEVYGDPRVHPQREDYWGHVNSIGPRACYDEGKRCAETLFFDHWRAHGVRIKVARLFNTYGPQMNILDGRVVSNFVVQALTGKPITIYGDGSQTRSFCYVDDLIDGILHFMRSADDFVGPVNLGNPTETTVLQLAETVVGLTNSTTQVEFKPLPTDDPQKRQPDITLARKQLGWEPSTTLETGLMHTIEYFEAVLSGAGRKRTRSSDEDASRSVA